MNPTKGFPNGYGDKVVERRHNQRRRRILIGLFTVQILLLLLVFPSLLLYFENRQMRLGADEMPGAAEPREDYSYVDGLYWSLLTPLKFDSVSDWPQTPPGKVLVRVSDITKVMTVAVLAALVHDFINSSTLVS